MASDSIEIRLHGRRILSDPSFGLPTRVVLQERLFRTLLLSNLSTISCTCQHTCCKVLLRNSNAPAVFKSNGDIYLPACPLSAALGSAETSRTIPSFVRTRIPGFRALSRGGVKNKYNKTVARKRRWK